MTSFIIIAFLITVAALAIMLWPLRKNRNSISYARQAQNIHFAKERIHELEEQLKNASISATDYEALKLEIETTLADDIDIANQNTSEQTVDSPKPNKFIIIALCTLVPFSAASIYALAGTPESFELAEQSKQQPNKQDINALLERLEQRIKDNPNDTEALLISSRTYLSMGRFYEAQQGFKKLITIEGESAPLLISLADASTSIARGVMAGEPMSYVERALKLNPEYPQGLWMAGLGAIQIGDTVTAVDYWTRLDPMLANSPVQQQELRDLIAQAKQETAKGSIQQQNNADPAPEQAEETLTGIKVLVSLDPAIIAKASPSDVVFVFAKATQGPPAPLAAKRLTVADLPATVYLSDADAMIAQFKLSLFKDVSISARVSKSGNPIAQAGDIQSDAVNVKNDTKDAVNVIISSEVK